MAMCGCFVPADYASFRWVLRLKVTYGLHIFSIHDALLSRLSNDDDMEKSLSTFANEMTSSAMILGKYSNSCARMCSPRGIGLATPKTLVIVDELGRGTSPCEGVGIAHAIAEELIKIKVGVGFAFDSADFSRLVLCVVRNVRSSFLQLEIRIVVSHFLATFMSCRQHYPDNPR